MSYSAEVYGIAQQEMEHRRTEAELALEKRRDILYARSPRAEAIEREMARTGAAAAKAVMEGADIREKLEALKDTNLALQKELADIVKGFGFPENYLEPWYRCSVCRDRGDVDGRMCTCMKSLLRQISYDQLNKCSPLELSDFDSFSLDYYDKTPLPGGRPSPYTQMMKVLGFCKMYARSFGVSSKSLLFQGAPGLGKTHLSLAIARELIEKGFGVIYASAPSLLKKLAREEFDYDNRPGDNPTELLLTDCDLLILDDLGTEFASRSTVAALYQILNSRTILSKPTIVSTNLSLADLQEMYNMRIISRIIGTLHRVEFIGSDIRQQKRRRRLQRSDEI